MRLPDRTLELIEKQVPKGMCLEENVLHDALESMALALYCDGISIEIIENAIVTTVDAYTNHC